MPTKPGRACRHPNCPAVVTDPSGYCERHRREERRRVDQERLSPSARGYDWRWAKAARAFLREHPLCAECLRQERLTPATEVDHITPHKGDVTRFWDVGNWQGLCRPCHSAKTAREDGRWTPTPPGGG